jgi:serine/threonine protein kinase
MSIINNKFKIRKLISESSTNDILLAHTIKNEKVVIKFEKKKHNEGEHSMLRHEFKIYKELQGAYGYCKVYWFGQHDGCNVLIFELLYHSIENLFNKCHLVFTLKSVLQLADQMLVRIQQLHESHIIHRDIKPANMAMGLGKNSNVLYFIDFGLSKRYRNPKTEKHIPYGENKEMIGTPRFASINNHLGRELSRRDDLESIGYVIVFLLRGFLPWQGNIY